VRDLSGKAPDREDDGEHVGRDTDRAKDDAAVEVDVRVQLALDEVGIGQCDLFKPAGNVEQRIPPPRLASRRSTTRASIFAPGSKFLYTRWPKPIRRTLLSLSFAMRA
jgi:hypothetical protein